jgi:hypothetical protein
MKGGAIPFLAWGALLVVLFAGNTVWNGKLMDSLASGFAAAVILAYAAALMLLGGRRATRKGAPEASGRPEPVATSSLGAVAAGLSLACALFGFVFGSFLIYFGAGMLLLSLGRVIVEVRAEHRSLREVSDGETGRRP